MALRVCPETSSGITKFSEHKADGGQVQESQRLAIEIFPILGEVAAAVEPCDRSFDDPAPGQFHEPLKGFGGRGSVSVAGVHGYRPVEGKEADSRERAAGFDDDIPF